MLHGHNVLSCLIRPTDDKTHAYVRSVANPTQQVIKAHVTMISQGKFPLKKCFVIHQPSTAPVLALHPFVYIAVNAVAVLG